MKYQTKRDINYDFINDLYIRWLNERNPFVQRKIKENIKERISPYELLMYSIRYCSPFEAFRNIFSLSDLFTTLEEMKKQGEDIRHLTNQSLVITGIEDIQILNECVKKGCSSEIGEFRLKFQGSNIFKYGDVKGIGKTFTYACINFLDLEVIDKMLNKPTDYKGIPVIITIDNIGQLPLAKLENIEHFFDITGIRIVEKERESYTHQGEQRPLNLKTYKQIMKVVNDEIINKLYVNENIDKLLLDYQLSTQIFDKLANIIVYDFIAAEKPRFSDESVNASGLVGLLTRKSICKGYSEIFRNILSCVGIESKVIDGELMSGRIHSWNQVKLGNTWFNADVTFARNQILKGDASGDLFMSDTFFFEKRKPVTFEKGKKVNGKSIETTVIIGGHKNAFGVHHKCETYITPYVTSDLIKRTRQYDEEYKKHGKSEKYKGPIPYVGSSIEKMHSSTKNIKTPTYPEH